MSKNLEGMFNKVPKKSEVLVMCPLKSCDERGEYIRCYFDIYTTCSKYIKYKRNHNSSK